MKSPFQPRTRILEEKRKTDTPAAVKPNALSDDLWVVRFWQQSQIDHLRLSSALAQICLDVQHALQCVVQQLVNIFTSFQCLWCPLCANLR